MLHHSLSVFLVFVLLCSAPVHALPHGLDPAGRSVMRVVRRDGLDGPQTVTTTESIDGVAIETCVITLTPTTDSNGNAQVIEVKECTVTMGSSTTSSSASSTATVTSSSTGVASASSTSIVANSPVSVNSVSSVTLSATAASATASTGSSGSSASPGSSASSSVASSITGGAIGGISTGSVSATASSTSSTSASDTGTAVSATGSGTATTDSTTQSGTAAAENTSQSASATPFAIPGRTLSVLPIGLGVFAGISVIALIVVALVTYERTKYRKAFRQRKLAESGASMGYGGMAQRGA